MVGRKQRVILFRSAVCMGSHTDGTVTLLGEREFSNTVQNTANKMLKMLLLLDAHQFV